MLLGAAGLMVAGCDSPPTGPGRTPEPVAPDQIAFTSWDSPTSSPRIYVVDSDGTQPRSVPLGTAWPGSDAMSWAPDHSRLAVSNGYAIYLVDTAGTGPVKLPIDSALRQQTQDVIYDHEPAWSPDGTRIAFTRLRMAPREENANDFSPTAWTRQACIAGVDGSNVTCLDGLPGRASSPAWSPDGRKLVVAVQEGTPPTTLDTVSCPTVLYLVNVDGTHARAITVLPPEMRCGARYDGDSHPQWSPHGDRIVFTSDRGALSSSHVYAVDTAGTNVTQLTQTPAGFATCSDLSPVWSPDGSRIAYTHQAWTASGKADRSGGVYVMSADGSSPTAIVTDVFAKIVVWR